MEPDPGNSSPCEVFFACLDNRHISRTNIMEKFLERIKEKPEIQLRFVEFGDGA